MGQKRGQYAVEAFPEPRGVSKSNLLAEVIIPNLKLFQARMICAVALGMGSSFCLATAADEHSAEPAPAKTSIPWSQIGVKAVADYKADELAVTPTADGARLLCTFQRLEADATREGLWLTSTVTNAADERFRIVATAVGRRTSLVRTLSTASLILSGINEKRWKASLPAIAHTGTVSIEGKIARFTRPGLVEEYTVSMDGVRQDFVVLERPEGAGELALRLAVSGAKVEPAAFGARLVLENFTRKIAYSRLRVTDAKGQELSARIEALSAVRGAESLVRESNAGPATHADKAVCAPMLVVVVNDADAAYPVRIDPTFSDANWISMGGIPGPNGLVFATVVAGSGDLYIGGYFTVVGDVIANSIAKWNGSNWMALGSGTDGAVSALAVSGSDVYAGGYFKKAGGSAANSIAKWDGSSWSALGPGMNGEVMALAVSGSDLYAGGWFTMAGGRLANNIAKWNGSSWSGLALGTIGLVRALAVSGSDLYAGGDFISAGVSGTTQIAKWNGSSWTALGSGMNSNVYALAVSGSDVYAGGYFTRAGSSAASSIAKWNGSSWTVVGVGIGGYSPFVLALAVSGSDLYAGGYFTTAGGTAANHIAEWDGCNWTALGSGMGWGKGFFPYVSTVTASDSDVYVGGNFTTAGGTAANYIAKRIGSSWAALGSGMGGARNPSVSALAVSGSDLYAGGDFTKAGGNPANSIAKWDGSSWTALGQGMNGNVLALAVSGSDLYAGGGFTTAGSSPANRIAKWDGSNWTALGSGMSDYVLALAVSGNDLYAGGQFTTAGDSPVNYIAKWNGSNWTALGSGMGSGGIYLTNVSALAVSGSNVYAGGQFTTAGGSPANYVAKWNGRSWSALGSGMNNIVYALAVSGSDLYAAGYFMTAGGSAANNIAKWDGSRWTALGSGMNSEVQALAVSGSDLYCGGQFTTAGGKVSAYVARAYLRTLPGLSVLRSGRDVMVSWPSADTADFALEQAGTLAASAGWVTNTPSVTDDGSYKSVTIPPINSPQFFRLRRP